MRLAGNVCAQRLDEPRLADARFAGDEDHRSLARAHLLPALAQQPQLVLAPHKRCKAVPPGHVETAARAARLEYLVQRDWLAYALETARAVLLDDEQAGDQPLRCAGDQDGVG